MVASDRRDEFAAAALRLVAADGLEAVSVRSVAAEAGWSAGAVQKAFPTKRELVTAAVALMIRRVTTRMDALPATGDLITDVAALTRETLPLDERRREEALVWSAVAGRAAHEAWMADVLAEQDRAVLGALTEAIGAECPEEPDPAAVASAVVALADGWCTRLLYDPSVAAQVERALARSLALLFRGSA